MIDCEQQNFLSGLHPCRHIIRGWQPHKAGFNKATDEAQAHFFDIILEPYFELLLCPWYPFLVLAVDNINKTIGVVEVVTP
jgi:hypothetical protein